MNTNDLNTALYEKMAAEQDKYRDWLKSQPPEEILHHTYEYTVREDIVMAMEELELTDAQAQALLESPSPLEDVYRYFEKLEPGQLRAMVPWELEPVPWTGNGFYYSSEAGDEGGVRPSKHPAYYCGLYYLQEPSAMTPAAMLPVKPGDRVLDLCAAPGGKSTELGARLKGRGMLVSNDISYSRARALLKNLELAGIPNICVTSESPERLAEVWPEFFDKILVDAPCSGEGMFRRDEDMVKDWTAHGPSYYAPIQRQIAVQAVRMLKPGGMLLYSTCTFSRFEDEGNIEYILEHYPQMELCTLDLSAVPGAADGIESPGWYHYLWHHPEDDGTLWVSRIASLLRQKNMDISVAHVIETVRLAQVTAALRDLPYPSLNEYNEAVTTVMGFGDDILLQIIKEELIISNRLGSVPDDVPKVPLLVDVEKIQKRLRVPFTAEIKELILDLRKPNDLERSIFFHRLQLLGIDWTILGRIDGKGTFKEKWTLYHKPEQIIQIIERAIWGNTVMEATQKYLLKQMAEIQHIPELTALLSTVLPADLPALVEAMTVQLDRLSAASTDILEMMEAVPDLVNIVRYGNVRNLDFSKVGDMLEAMIARILAGGVLVCINIDEEAAGDLLNKLVATDYALSILNREELNLMWRNFIGQVRSSANVHPLLSGYATRLLNDKGEISAEEMETTLSFYSSVGNAPADMAYWFEGFLRSSGSILLLDDRLWNLVNNWVCSQDKETFMELLPVLRRTFSEFTSAERRKLGEKARRTDSTGTSSAVGASVTENECLNREEAKKVIPVIRQLLGLETK